MLTLEHGLQLSTPTNLNAHALKVRIHELKVVRYVYLSELKGRDALFN